MTQDPRAALGAIAKLYGASVDWDVDGHVAADAPRGCVWSRNGGHRICEAYENPAGQECLGDAIRLLIADMKYGIRPCIAADCGVCESEATG